MQHARVEFTNADLAKYPFLKETAEYIRPLGLQIEDLTSAEMTQVLRLAKNVVSEGMMHLIRFPII